jgi:hypothetical protein
MNAVTKLLIALSMTALLTACGGGDSAVKSEITTTTTGQQLTDLKKALDAGAINQSEYETQRKKILDKQ